MEIDKSKKKTEKASRILRNEYFCAMESTRQEKIEKLIQKDLGEIFQQKEILFVPGAMITVTKVRVSKDLGVAKIFLSIFAAKDKEEALALIKSKTKEVRYKLGNRIRHQLRIVPELIFYLDDSLDYIENIENALKKG